jgi:signal transduction histidine kinase
MRERALELGGTCTVETLPGRGTVVSALIPLTSLVADTESAGESAPTPGESGLRR